MEVFAALWGIHPGAQKREIDRMKIELKGKTSTFVGPHDMAVKPSEGLALVSEHNEHHFAEYFLPTNRRNDRFGSSPKI